MYVGQPYAFQSTQSQPPKSPVPISPSQRYPYQHTNTTSHSQSLEPADPLESRESNTSDTSSIVLSPHIHDHTHTTDVFRPTAGAPLIRNARFANNAQKQLQLQRAIHTLSRDFRLRGHPYTIESMLLPLIFHSNALKYAIIANFVLQAEQANPLSWPMQSQNQNVTRLDVVYYRNARNILQTTFSNPIYININVGTALMLAFYDICAGHLDHYSTNMRKAADQIRLRGITLDTHPLELRTKFLFNLFVKIDLVASNVCRQQGTVDYEIIQIVHSGVSIFNTDTLPYRMELELLLAEISQFQCECATVLSVDHDWNDPAQEEALRRKYEDLLDRLHRWKGADSQLIYFEEAELDNPRGIKLPLELGLPLLCVTIL